MSEGTALLLGCGSVGKAVAGLLGKDRAFRRVITADREPRRADAASQLCGDKAESVRLESSDDVSLGKLLGDVSLVVNTMRLPLSEALPLIRSVVEAGVSYVDSSVDTEVVQAVFDSAYLESTAGYRAVSVVPGLGASPGLTNALTSYLGQRLERVDEADFFLLDDLRRRTRRQWRERLAAFGSPALVWRNGDWREVAPLSEFSEFPFPSSPGAVRCCVVSLGPVTLPGSIGTLERVASHRGFAEPDMMDMVGSIVELGLASEDPVEAPDGPLSPLEFAASFFSQRREPWSFGPASRARFWNDEPAGPLVRQAQVAGMLRGRATRFTMTYQFPGEEEADSIAATLAIGARMLLTREVPAPGVHPPEALDPAPFLWDMERRGAQIQLTKTFDDEA